MGTHADMYKQTAVHMLPTYMQDVVEIFLIPPVGHMSGA